MNKLNVLELFSGIGGMHYALQESGVDCNVVEAVEINPIANKVYAYNFPNTKLQNRNVQYLTENHVNKNKINAILMSPPCQPFTRVGNQKDIDDNRTNAFIFICELLLKLKSIDYILVENVKGFETSKARNLFIDNLKKSGFYFREFLLSPTYFRIPNSRLRYYCIARRKKDFNFEQDEINDKMPYENNEFKQKILKDFLEDNLKTEGTEIPDEILMKRYSLMDIKHPESNNSMCFTKAYTRYVEGTGSVFTEFSEDSMKTLREENELDENCIKKLKLRYFTPREVARLMCFPDSFNFPNDITETQKYRLLGNSLNVLVVSELIKLLVS